MATNSAVPSSQDALVVPQTGLVTPAWLRFFTLLLAQPGPVATIALTGSPFSFTASVKGTAFVSGGTVSLIQITRSRVTMTTGQTSGNVPLAQGDVLIVTYSVAPTIKFVPG